MGSRAAAFAALLLSPVGCAERERPPRPGPEPPAEGWPEQLRFAVACAETTTEIALDVGGLAEGLPFRIARPVASSCDAIAARAELVDEVSAACAASGHLEGLCAELEVVVGAELDRPYARPGFAVVTAFPSEPDGADTWADLELEFADGTSERWITGDRPWGRRFTWLGEDGAFTAQGSRLFDRARLGRLRCAIERDHTADGRYLHPARGAGGALRARSTSFDVWWREVNALDCGGDARPPVSLVLTQRLRTLEEAR